MDPARNGDSPGRRLRSRSLRSAAAGVIVNEAVEPETDHEDRSEHVPPIDERPHLGVAGSFWWIDFADRNFGGAVAEPEQLDQKIDFELVAVEPVLPQIDPGIVQHRDLHRPVAVRALRHALASEHADQERMKPRRQLSVERHLAPVTAAGQKTRAYHEVKVLVANRIEKTRDLFRRILVVAG